MHAPRIPVLEVDLGPGIRAFFTTRDGGVSTGPWAGLNVGTAVGDAPGSVEENRRLVEDAAGGPVTFVSQVHGREVHLVAEGAAPTTSTAPVEADALVAPAGGMAVGVYVADCVPVLLADPGSGVVAAVHAGRPGVEAGVVTAAVQAMVAAGADPAQVRAAVGPAVCGRCYEVPEDLQARVGGTVPDALSTTAWGTPALDLPRAVAGQLRAAGVRAVDRLDVCTRTDERFYSHRRASAEGLVTGRFAGVVRPPSAS
ncbi:conserved hypothetical protein TIGR00726 [Sanguibacter keddieii DSM 10542]|uniref:Purine nucleoside phosphorylase n=1 Tax=Sanguibacter keddieii (strain ATCC 51767 / DSM 10542 / NCFB 3025 / ST-74) TaxID=446469 RepID=D1BIL4_SANKS|nr:polyphenol oxidase family protein [Sanguibacter keddieii]ACZ22191.1 conserved hypothetical protein TIGR00726 [Sanguibacter keddieii DSM 10542]